MQAAPLTLSLWPDEDPPAAAPRGRVAQEWRLYDVWDHPGHGATPRRLQTLFREAEDGWWLSQLRLFDDQIEADAHLRNLFEQLEGAVSCADWDLQADGTDGDSELGADILEQALNDLPMELTFGHQLRAIRHGAAESEIEWVIKRINGRDWVVPGWFADLEITRFCIDQRTDALRLLTQKEPVKGVALDAGKWWETRMPGPRVARAGLMRTASWLALAKRDNSWDWVIYAHKFGLPGVLARIPQTASPAAKAALRRFVQEFGNDGGAVIEEPPDGGEVKVDLQAAATADSSGTHGGLITYCNREMSKLVNGSTLSNDNSDSGGASYALGQVHESSKWDAIKARSKMLKQSFRRCVALPFWHFNSLTGRPPKLEIRVVREERPLEQIELLERQVKLGAEGSKSQLRGITGWHEPLGDDDRIGSVGEVRALAGKAPSPKPSGDPPATPKNETEGDAAPVRSEDADAESPKSPVKQPTKTSDAKLFQYHLPFMKVRELRARLGFTEAFDGDDENAAEWANKFAPAPVETPAPEEAA